jgi:hypothetical protein
LPFPPEAEATSETRAGRTANVEMKDFILNKKYNKNFAEVGKNDSSKDPQS